MSANFCLFFLVFFCFFYIVFDLLFVVTVLDSKFFLAVIFCFYSFLKKKELRQGIM